MEIRESVDTIKAETQEVKEQIELLSVTDGWAKLSDKQQQYIKDSLYVTKRAYREYGDTNNPRYGKRLSDEIAIFPEKIGQKPVFESKYKESQDRIADWYCHYSVFVLENEGIEPNPSLKKVDSSFATEKFDKYPDETGLIAKIEEVGFPCVVQVSGNEVNSQLDTDDMVHSIVVLGKNAGGYLCWEKKDKGQKYDVSNLKQIFQERNKDYLYWGVRKLRKLG